MYQIIIFAMFIVFVWGCIALKRGLNPFVSIAAMVSALLVVFGIRRNRAARPATVRVRR